MEIHPYLAKGSSEYTHGYGAGDVNGDENILAKEVGGNNLQN